MRACAKSRQSCHVLLSCIPFCMVCVLQPQYITPDYITRMALCECGAHVLFAALLTLARNRIATRLAAVSEVATVALQAGFGLLDRLGEVESMVRVLQLVSVMVEVMDSRIQPQLPIIAANLTRVSTTCVKQGTNITVGMCIPRACFVFDMHASSS